MPRNGDACGCSGDDDEGDLIDFGSDDTNFIGNYTQPSDFFSPDSVMNSTMNNSDFITGSPRGAVPIPSINMSMCYDNQGNVVPEQRYSKAEEDFLNRTIQSSESQSRRSSNSYYGAESPPGSQYGKGRKAGLWDSGRGTGTACGGGSPCSKSSESSYGQGSTPRIGPRMRAQQRGSEGGGGGRPSTSPAGLIPTLRSERPQYARDTVMRPGQASLIPVPNPRTAQSRFRDSPVYEESFLDHGGAGSSRGPVNYQQQNIDNIKNYPDPRYTYVPKHKFPGKSPSGAQRRSEPVQLGRNLRAADLDVSGIPIDAAIHPHRKESVEPMVSGMLSHVCGNRGGPVGGARPPIPGINQSIHGGRFTCPALEQANTWLPNAPVDDDIQVIHSPRPQSVLQDDEDDDEVAEFEAYEAQFNNESIASKTLPNASRKSYQSPELIDLCNCSDTTSPNASKKSRQSPEFIDLCDDSVNSSPNTTRKSHLSDKSSANKPSPKAKKVNISPEIIDLCDDSIFEDMEKNVLEQESDNIAEESASFYPSYSQLPLGDNQDTWYGFGDVNAIAKLIQEENNDVSVAVDLSMPSRVNTTLNQTTANIFMNSVNKSNVATATSSRNISASGPSPGNVSMGGNTTASTAADLSDSSRSTVIRDRSPESIPVMAEDRDMDHVFAANMTMVQEQGLSLSSPPHQIANLLFPPDDGECLITAIIDSVQLEGAVVPMRPSRIRLPPNTTEQMDETSALADSFLRSAPDRMAGPKLNVTLGTNLNIPVVDLISPDTTLDESVVEVSPTSSPRHRTGKDFDPVEESRSIGAINSGRLVGDTEFIMDPGPQTGTWIQLRGHREPSWFPGYYVSLPSFREPVALVRTASEVLPQAWYAVHSDLFQEENNLALSS